MDGTEKQERKTPITSVYIPAKYRKMIDTMVNCGYYKNVSDCVRGNIEKDFYARISNPKAMLKQREKELTATIEELKGLILTSDDTLTDLVDRYIERKGNMSIKALDRNNYESYSKKWIEKNLEDANEAFPGKSIDEIFIELERLMTKGDDE
jgi:Arc/MetJ-type ribon-helix-helix transcriptional regulator